jgi:hypothetical protein
MELVGEEEVSTKVADWVGYYDAPKLLFHSKG